MAVQGPWWGSSVFWSANQQYNKRKQPITMLKKRFRGKENAPELQVSSKVDKMAMMIQEVDSAKDIDSLVFRRVRTWFMHQGIEQGDPESIIENQSQQNKARILMETSMRNPMIEWAGNVKQSQLNLRRKKKCETMFQMR